ncbi:MAG: TonB-dependent receptor [Acidobacteriota bacterium]
MKRIVRVAVLVVGVSTLFASSSTAADAGGAIDSSSDKTNRSSAHGVASDSSTADAADPAGSAATDSTFADEITVTGQQQVRGLQDTPESVAVTSGSALEQRSTVDLYQLVEVTPNVNASFGFKGFSVRGIDQRGFGGGGGQLVTVIVDGATLNNQATFFGPYSAWDLEQVEIFRGPQSTQQGRNALAGAIVIRSADPTYERDVKGRLSIGTLGSSQASVAVNLPLIENKVALRFSVDNREFDGWVENPTRGEDDYDFREALTARGKLRFDLTERFSGLLSFSYTDSTGGEDVIQQDLFPDRRFNFSDEPAEEGSVHEIVHLELSYLLNDRWSIQSSTNMYDHDYIRTEDGDMTALTGNRLQVDQNDQSFTQQLRFLYGDSRGRSAVLGVYYADLEDLRDSRATLPGEILGLPPGFIITGLLDLKVFTENLALFGEIDLPLGERFTVTAGARFDNEEKRDASNQMILIDPPLFELPTEPPQDLESEYDAFLPKLGLSYEVSESTTASFTFQEGYRAGGRSQSLISLTVSDFEPERTANYELAWRTFLPDRGLRVNANAFYIDWDDQQVSVRTDLDSEFDTITVNAGSSRLYGLEAQVDYRVSEALDVFGSLGWVETEFTDFTDGDEDFTGNEFPFAPNLSGTLGMNWRPADLWLLSASVNYQDSYFSEQDNDPRFKADERTLVNLRLSYDWDQVTLAAFARNLFDEDYLIQAFPNGARSGEPQILGLEISFGL